MKLNYSTAQPRFGDRQRWLALVVICFGQLMIMLDSTIVNVALPAIQHDLHFTQANLTWVVNGYLIAYGSLLLLAGRAGDLIGRKRVFLAGVAVFTVASGLDGLAYDSTTLIAARLLRGLGGALSAGVILALIVTGFPKPDERAQAMSIFMFVIAGGGSLGLLAGGNRTQLVNWDWVFFINLALRVGPMLLGWWLIQAHRGPRFRQAVNTLCSIIVNPWELGPLDALIRPARGSLSRPRNPLCASAADGVHRPERRLLPQHLRGVPAVRNRGWHDVHAAHHDHDVRNSGRGCRCRIRRGERHDAGGWGIRPGRPGHDLVRPHARPPRAGTIVGGRADRRVSAWLRNRGSLCRGRPGHRPGGTALTSCCSPVPRSACT